VQPKQVLPSASALFLWLMLTVPLPLAWFSLTHRWEERPIASTVLWWTVAALPLPAATASARAARNKAGFLAATVTGTVAGTLHLGLSAAFYQWVVPLPRPVGHLLFLSLPLAAAGAAVGYAIGRRRKPRPRRGPGWLRGVVIAVAGMFLIQLTVGLGALYSTVGWEDPRDVRAVGPMALDAGVRYGIFDVGRGNGEPDCTFAGPGRPRVRAVPTRPGDYGNGDYASFRWVAYVTVPVRGTYVLTCEDAVGPVPRIRGLVGKLVYSPLPALFLLGSLPGLWLLGSAVSARYGRTSVPPTAPPAPPAQP
jgi:hypothetical protein